MSKTKVARGKARQFKAPRRSPAVHLTKLKRTEDKIRESRKRYRNLFDLVPVAVYTCDPNGVIREFNRRAVELWGRKPGQNGEKPRFCGS